MSKIFSAEQILSGYYQMMYPQTLREDEFIRLVAIRNNMDGSTERFVRFVRSFEEFSSFVRKYRYEFDLFAQVATNRGNEDGQASSQWRRRVLFLDYDRKDHPGMTTAKDCMEHIHGKLPKLFIHCIVDSGHGFHCYVSVPETDRVADVVGVNKLAAEVTGADPKAVSPAQICRIPCSFNHKVVGGSDYCIKDNWRLVKVVSNAYGGRNYKPLDLPYVKRMCDTFLRDRQTEEQLEKIEWHYDELPDAPRYLCIRRAMTEGVDKGQRNFWHGRIVAMLEKEGYTPSAIRKACQDYNSRCRPSKSPEEIDKDTDRYLKGQYKLLGCYEAFAETDPRRAWVCEMCDKVHCGTYHAGATVTVEGGRPARINRKALDNRSLREMDGIHFLVLTIVDVYAETYGRRGFRIKDLAKLLHSSVAKRQCVSDRRLKVILAELAERRYIEIVPDRKDPGSYKESRLKLSRRLLEFQRGYIQLYFSVANAVIDGKISQTDYRVFITLARNLQLDHKAVTYEQLADDLGMDPQNVGKSIRKLRDERCLIVRKQYTERGYEYNHYQLMDPDVFKDDGPEVISLMA